MSRHPLSLACLVLLCSLSAAAQQPSLHVLRISAGPAGVEEKGTFRLTEERAVFSRTDDKEVIVYFQWEGTPGRHILEATWRSPDGTSSSKSTIDYTAKDRRFGAYWRFAVTPEMRLGMWSIEATVDGQPAGRFTFEVTGAPAPPPAPVKRPLTHPELHALLSQYFVVLNRVGPGVRPLDPAAGVIATPGQVFTAVRPLDAVDRVSAVASTGTTQEVTTVVDVNRAAGWAILQVKTDDLPPLPHAAEPRVGDRCFAMQGSEGGRILLEGQVTGTTGAAGRVEGWLVSFANGVGVAGTLVVNEFGEALGILGRRATPEGFLPLSAYAGQTIEIGNVPVIPIGTIGPRPGSTPGTFEEFRSRGLLLAPLVHEEHVVSGGFASETPRGKLPPPNIQRVEFSRVDKQMVVFVTWSPRTRLKGQAAFHLFDASNQRLASSKDAKVDLRANDIATSLWHIPVTMVPGIYRAELHLDGKPVWRNYVRINP